MRSIECEPVRASAAGRNSSPRNSSFGRQSWISTEISPAVSRQFSGTKIAPMRTQAKWTARKSGLLRASTATRAPAGSSRCASSNAAARSMRRSNSR